MGFISSGARYNAGVVVAVAICRIQEYWGAGGGGNGGDGAAGSNALANTGGGGGGAAVTALWEREFRLGAMVTPCIVTWIHYITDETGGLLLTMDRSRADMKNSDGQLYTIEGFAAGLIMIMTAYLVVNATSVYTAGDTHISDMQLEALGSDALTMMATPTDTTMYLSNTSPLRMIIENPIDVSNEHSKPCF